MPAKVAHQTPWRWAHKIESFAPARVVFYDSEFVRERSYFPRLALMQWQVAGVATAVLCDPLSAQQPPWQALLHHQAPIVMHSGNQDLELIAQESGHLPHTVRDTQIGFALCHRQMTVGIGEMVEHYLDVTVDKSATRSDWLKRPLTREQLNYAANDVGLLCRIYAHLCAELNALGRMTWWAEDCQYLLAYKAQPQLTQPWYKLRNAPQLRGRETAIAALLHRTREHIAQLKNIPRKKILEDNVILDIAQSGIEYADELAEYIDSDHLIFSQYAALEEGFANMAKPYPTIPRAPRLNTKQREYFERLGKRCQEVAEALDIHPDMLSTQKHLRYFVAGEASDCRIDQGWRRPFFADMLHS